MNVKATDLRKGMVLIKDGDLLIITDYSHHTPGNWRSIIQVKTRSLKSGSNSSFRPMAGDSFEMAYLERKKAQYLYKEANGDFVFMDNETYDQFTIPADIVASAMSYVKENSEVEVTFHEGLAISIALPSSVVLEVRESENAVKGNTATNVKKDAILETGLQIKVPLHIKAGEMVKVNTETGEFLGRVNE